MKTIEDPKRTKERMDERLKLYHDLEQKHIFSPAKPVTNADRIRSMNDEDLAMALTLTNYVSPPWCADYNEPCRFIEEDHTPCEECALDWLKEEVENGKA